LSNSPGTHAVPAQPAGQAAQWSQPDTPRPGTLTATFIVADMAAVFGLAGAVLTFAVGKSMLRSMIGVGTLHGAAGDFVNGLIEGYSGG
jgi:hypothetical protein